MSFNRDIDEILNVSRVGSTPELETVETRIILLERDVKIVSIWSNTSTSYLKDILTHLFKI